MRVLWGGLAWLCLGFGSELAASQDDQWLRAKTQDLGFLGLNHDPATNYLLTLTNLCNVSLSVFPHLENEHNNNPHTVFQWRNVQYVRLVVKFQ